MTMLHPANMQQHGPARTIEQYREYLSDELDREPPHTARAHDLRARLRMIDDELRERVPV